MLWKYGLHYGWGCPTYSILESLGNPVSYHHWIELDILLNWPLHTFRHIRFRLVGEVSVGVEPVCMVYGGVSKTPALYRGIGTTCCLYYGHFTHTHTCGHGVSLGIVWAIWDGKRWVFLIQPVRWIYDPIKFSSWGHESHWRLPPWVFIIRFLRS